MVTDLLKKTAIFADLDEGELQRVAEICKEQKFASQAPIFKEGEPGNRLYVIVTGEVRISRTVPGAGEEALAVLKPGSCFGEMRQPCVRRSGGRDRPVSSLNRSWTSLTT